MPKEKLLEMTGQVIECLPDANFLVKLDGTETVITAYISGTMRKHQIRILNGDRVTVEMTAYDLTKGRIRFREK